jgi:hypothetical protein
VLVSAWDFLALVFGLPKKRTELEATVLYAFLHSLASGEANFTEAVELGSNEISRKNFVTHQLIGPKLREKF